MICSSIQIGVDLGHLTRRFYWRRGKLLDVFWTDDFIWGVRWRFYTAPQQNAVSLDSVRRNMEKIVNPENEAELALFKSLFEAEGIRYFVHNENFGSILIGPKMSNYNV